MTEIIYSVANEEDGIAAEVTAGRFGYHVVLRDTDAGEVVPMAMCFPTLDRAKAKADEIAA